MWAATRGISRIFNKKEQKVSWILLLISFLTLLYPLTRVQINMFNDYFAKGALYIVFVYPLLLFGAVLIKKKFFRKKDESNAQKNE
jgi:uncharacterized membrane protein